MCLKIQDLARAALGFSFFKDGGQWMLEGASQAHS